MKRKILVPVDLSEDSPIVLERALSNAVDGDELILCHIVPDPAEIAGFHIPHLSTELTRKEIMDEATRDMESFINAEAPGTPSRIRMGIPFREILKVAEEEMVDLIVIGSHKAGALEHLLVSHASEKVIRYAMCEVLVIPLKIESEEQLKRRRAKLWKKS